jgi:hypothetical protein
MLACDSFADIFNNPNTCELVIELKAKLKILLSMLHIRSSLIGIFETLEKCLFVCDFNSLEAHIAKLGLNSNSNNKACNSSLISDKVLFLNRY